MRLAYLMAAMLLLCSVFTAVTAAVTTVTIDITSPAQFETCTRDAGIDTMSMPGAVQLAPIEYFVEDMGNRIGSAAPAASWGKKVFTLDTPGATRGELFTYNNPGKATFNGTPLTFTATSYGAWFVAEIPADAVRAGVNELVMPTCAVPVDLEHQANHSFFSADKGTTWQQAKGEFLAHLHLYRHPAQGVITSEVIDLTNPNNGDIICSKAAVTSLSVAATTNTPAGTAAKLVTRSGNTPRPDATWSDWAVKPKPARYVQWRATLSTKNHAVTPRLDAVRITAKMDVMAAPAVTVKQFANQRIVRSSFTFTYQTPSEKLSFLRKNWNLDAVVAPGKTEMEKYILLRNWVRKQWPHNEGACRRPWDAIDILNAPAGDHGMCVHFGVTYTQCALALGYNARQIILNNHYVSEIWVNDLQRWVLMDVESVQKEGWDRYGTALYTRKDTGAPMNGLDLHRAYKNNELDKVTQVLYMTDAQGNYAPNERTYGPEEYGNFRHITFPPRNNFLDQLEPWEVAHGVDHYHSNGYYWWSDTPVAIRGEYSVFSCREGDLYWTLNQAALTLTATTDPGKLDVLIDTETPNLKEFQYRLNGGAWQALPANGEGQTSRQATFTWTLQPGANTLEVKPRNVFGLDGITSSVTVVK